MQLVITSLIFNISPAHLAFATRNRAQHWLSIVMGIINSPQANLCHELHFWAQFHNPLWKENCMAQVTSSALVSGQGAPQRLCPGETLSPRPIQPWEAQAQTVSWLQSVCVPHRASLPAGEIQGTKTLGHYQPKLTHTINNHYFCTAYCLAPQPHLALLSASQLYTCSLPCSLQTMQLLGWLLKLQI